MLGQSTDQVSRDAAVSCEQLAKCVSDSVLAISTNNKTRIVACFTTLLLIAKVRPDIITPYVKVRVRECIYCMYYVYTVPGSLTLRLLRNFRKLKGKNIKLGNFSQRYDFLRLA